MAAVEAMKAEDRKQPCSQLPSDENQLHDITLDAVIGAGAHGCVYRGTWQGTTHVALKCIVGVANMREVLQEASIIRGLRHPNLLQYLGIFNPDTPLTCAGKEVVGPFLVTEYLSLGSLDSYLRGLGDAVTLKLVLELASGCAAGMHCLSEHMIVHRDLALRNLLVKEENNRYVVKVSDFGLSRHLVESQVYRACNAQQHMPFKWVAPECANYNEFTTKSDVWSFGVTLWEMCEAGKLPYGEFSNVETIQCVEAGYRLPCPAICNRFVGGAEVYQLMLQCWDAKPVQRPTFHTIFSTLQEIYARHGYNCREQEDSGEESADSGSPSDVGEVYEVGCV
eukprot:TRINITY_DN3373_c0_g1_i3.p2 TRINITY_DN3373_c0_g1~~TRINITY_DN3373_c0_g1_i3.p2  ORF type:complete len:337 (-),score=48.09 TRINITY_DN3373_c0_g1_i3:13-1023(-)